MIKNYILKNFYFILKNKNIINLILFTLLILFILFILFIYNNKLSEDFIDNNLKIGLKKNTYSEKLIYSLFQDYDKYYMNTELNIINNINNYNINYGIISLETYDEFLKSENIENNINFIASLYNINVNILSTNNSNVKLIKNLIYDRIYYINVIYENSIHHNLCIKILKHLNILQFFKFLFILDIKKNININKMDILFYVGINPSNYIKELLKKINMHYINLNLTDNFFKNNKIFKKELLNLHDININYPHLTIIDRNNNYISTISTKMILISNNKSEFKHITRIFKLKEENKLLNKLTLIENSYPILDIPYNKGVIEFYKMLKIHTTNEDWGFNEISKNNPPLLKNIYN